MRQDRGAVDAERGDHAPGGRPTIRVPYAPRPLLPIFATAAAAMPSGDQGLWR
jgi:hypothetical protein